MKTENLENFFNSDDGVIKTFSGKIRLCVVTVIVFLLYLAVYLFGNITAGSLIAMGVLLWIPVVLLIVFRFIKSNEARDNFYMGYCALTLSAALWYAVVLLLSRDDKIKYVTAVYFFLWAGCGVVICLGILKNIKLNLYEPEALKRQIKIDPTMEVYLIFGKSTKILFVVLIAAFLFQMIAPEFMEDVLRPDIHFQLMACCIFFMGWLGLFGWKLMLKAILLKKYTVL